MEVLAQLDPDVKTEQLWALACNVVQQMFDSENPGKAFRVSDRFLMYCNYMEQTITNYPDTTHGMEVLKYFNFNAQSGKAEWPIYFRNKWVSIRQSCRADLSKWIKQKNCPLTKEELKNMDDAVKARAYIGFMIDSQISATEYIANNHFNKHWPSHFNSGDSPNGLLQIIRRWYYDTIENPRKATNAFKVWANKNKSITDKWNERQKTEDIEKRMSKKRFTNSWYPPQWLSWYCYGPPTCNSNPVFAKTEMLHLNKVKAKSRLEKEELVTALGAQSKAVRRSHIGRGANNVLNNEVGDESNEPAASTTKLHQVNFSRNEPAIDRAIEACQASIVLMESMQGPDGLFTEQIRKKRIDLLRYLNQKETAAITEFETVRK